MVVVSLISAVISHQNSVTTTNNHNYLHAAYLLNLSADFYGKTIRTNAEIRTCEHVTDVQCDYVHAVLLYSQMFTKKH